jgi:hypothetical protein
MMDEISPWTIGAAGAHNSENYRMLIGTYGSSAIEMRYRADDRPRAPEAFHHAHETARKVWRYHKAKMSVKDT